MPSLAEGYLPGAVWVNNPAGAGLSYNPEPITKWKICLHEIQGDDRLDMIRSHPSPPQLWYDPVSRVLSQTIALTRAGFALYHYGGRRETNRANVIQVELAGFSSPLPDEPQAVLDNIAYDVIVPVCQFVATQGGMIDLTQVSGPFVYPGSASEQSVNRMTDDQFQRFPGLTAHGFAPQNEHWDVGGMDMAYIAKHALFIIAGMIEQGDRTDMTEAAFRLRPTTFDDPGLWGPNDRVWDHPWLPAGATIIVANRNPDLGAFNSVLYAPGFDRNDIAGVVRNVAFGAAVSYVSRKAGLHSVVIPEGAQADVFAVY